MIYVVAIGSFLSGCLTGWLVSDWWNIREARYAVSRLQGVVDRMETEMEIRARMTKGGDA